MHNTLYDNLQAVLKKDSRFFTEEGDLLRNAVYEAAMNMDTGLLRILLSDELLKVKFFQQVDGVLVFDKVGFGWVVNNRQFLPDSYTRYKNKIGIADENEELIATTGKVELVFPYKDCILEGGQTEEDQKKDEVFYNETLAPEEVDQLLYPKAFVHAKKYNLANIDGFTADCIEDTDNLIIKGNNLLGLSSLMDRYKGKVKCIYIDPPYFFKDNKNADTFGYNSNFKLSSWLVFMKNRLDLANKLLSSDGSIWISIGQDGQHYLKVLADSIFKDGEFVADITWQKTYSPRNDAHGICNEGESILVYSKNKNWQPNKLPRTADMDKNYKNPDNDRTAWTSSDPCGPGAVTHQGMVYAIQHPFTGEYVYPSKGACWRYQQNDLLEIMRGWCDYELKELDDASERAKICGISVDKVREGVQGIVLSKSIEESVQSARKVLERGQWPKYYFTKKGMGGVRRKTYIDEVEGKQVTNLWGFKDVGHTDEAKKEIIKLFGDDIFSTPKPERLLQRIIHAATNERDLVLDFNLGSGTTCAVAHKMNRQYIGIDQMDYIEKIAVERLKKVIEGEQGGISSDVNWVSGGSFVYCELAQLNQKYVAAIESADCNEKISSIYEALH